MKPCPVKEPDAYEAYSNGLWRQRMTAPSSYFTKRQTVMIVLAETDWCSGDESDHETILVPAGAIGTIRTSYESENIDEYRVNFPGHGTIHLPGFKLRALTALEQLGSQAE